MTQTTTIVRPAPTSPGAGRTGALDDDAARSWALVARAQAGDVDAVADLYRRYHAFVLALAAGRLGSRFEAEDVVADVFVRVLRSMHTFAPRGNVPFAAVLNTITCNLIRDHFKRSHTQLSRSYGAEDIAEMHDHVSAPQAEPFGEVANRSLRRDLRAALAELTPRQRRAIELRYLRDMSESQAAAEMGTNVQTLKALAYRGLRALRQQSILEGHR